jgi:hypothetical protein
MAVPDAVCSALPDEAATRPMHRRRTGLERVLCFIRACGSGAVGKSSDAYERVRADTVHLPWVRDEL